MTRLPEFTPFGGAELQTVNIANAGIVVLPLCYENAPSYGAGSADGAWHILGASEQLESLDEETWAPWHQKGVHTLPPLQPAAAPEAAMADIRQAAAAVLEQQKFLLSIGGDHAVSIGLVEAAAAICPEIGVLQIDAHLDLRDTWNGSRYNHACVMRRVHADMHLKIVQVGIRSFSPEEASYVRHNHLSPWLAHNLMETSDANWIAQVVATLPPQVYITLDLDGLDPSAIPGTGTPEPGGLSYRQVVALLKQVGRQRRVLAADITELTKMEGCQVSEYTAARLATKIFVYCA